VDLCYIADANSIHAKRWIEPFVRRGYNVHLLSYATIERRWSGVELVDLTRITNARKLRFVYWGWWIRRYLRRLQPDVLHAHQVQAAGWLGAMANYHPFIVSGWGSDILVEPHKSAFRRMLVKAVLWQCDRLTVPSQLMYDEAQSLGVTDAKLRLIPWGIETDIFRPTPNDHAATRTQLGIELDARVVLSSRKVSPLYNHDIILEAINAIRTKVPKLRLIQLCVNVDPVYLAKLKQVSTEYQLDGIVHWLPRQESISDIARLYRMSDAVVSIPSSEGYGFTVYEAMASGCPTLISDLPVFKDELVDGFHTLKVPVRDAARTGQALVDLLVDDDLRRQLRHNALILCQEKGVRKRIEQTEALYQELVQKPCRT
jgi:glycosyltransferase involved in cell wall biosynthesis